MSLSTKILPVSISVSAIFTVDGNSAIFSKPKPKDPNDALPSKTWRTDAPNITEPIIPTNSSNATTYNDTFLSKFNNPYSFVKLS